MTRRRRSLASFFTVTIACGLAACAAKTPGPPPDSCSGIPAAAAVAAWTADGYCLYKFADVAGARQIAFAPSGDLFVASNGGAIVDPILTASPAVHDYEPGTWGPPDAARLTADVGGWHSPGPPGPATPC